MASFCRDLERQIDAEKREVAQLRRELASSQQELRGLAFELRSALAKLRLSPPTGDASLSRILRELDNFPDPNHPAIPVVRRLISDQRTVGHEISETTINLAVAENRRHGLEADHARDC